MRHYVPSRLSSNITNNLTYRLLEEARADIRDVFSALSRDKMTTRQARDLLELAAHKYKVVAALNQDLPLIAKKALRGEELARCAIKNLDTENSGMDTEEPSFRSVDPRVEERNDLHLTGQISKKQGVHKPQVSRGNSVLMKTV